MAKRLIWTERDKLPRKKKYIEYYNYSVPMAERSMRRDRSVLRLAKMTQEELSRTRGNAPIYLKWKNAVYAHMNRVMPKKTGYHRDHVIPASLCRKMGLTIIQTNCKENLKYVCPNENMDKWADVCTETLSEMCRSVWGIEPPSKNLLEEHMRSAKMGENLKGKKKVL